MLFLKKGLDPKMSYELHKEWRLPDSTRVATLVLNKYISNKQSFDSFNSLYCPFHCFRQIPIIENTTVIHSLHVTLHKFPKVQKTKNELYKFLPHSLEQPNLYHFYGSTFSTLLPLLAPISIHFRFIGKQSAQTRYVKK